MKARPETFRWTILLAAAMAAGCFEAPTYDVLSRGVSWNFDEEHGRIRITHVDEDVYGRLGVSTWANTSIQMRELGILVAFSQPATRDSGMELPDRVRTSLASIARGPFAAGDSLHFCDPGTGAPPYFYVFHEEEAGWSGSLRQFAWMPSC